MRRSVACWLHGTPLPQMMGVLTIVNTLQTLFTPFATKVLEPLTACVAMLRVKSRYSNRKQLHSKLGLC